MEPIKIPLDTEDYPHDDFSWTGDFHYIEDFIPNMDEATKDRVWGRIMSGMDDD